MEYFILGKCVCQAYETGPTFTSQATHTAGFFLLHGESTGLSPTQHRDCTDDDNGSCSTNCERAKLMHYAA